MTPIKRHGRGRRGYALLLTMFTTALVMIVGAGMFTLASSNSRLAFRRQDNAKALAIAHAAGSEAVYQLIQSETWTGFQGKTFADGTVSCTVTTPVGQPTKRVISVTASVTRSSVTVSKTLQYGGETNTIPPLFYNALASKDDFVISGTVFTGSTPVIHQGNVHTNGSMYVNGAAVDIDGRATSSGSMTLNGGPTITGGTVSGVAPMVFPEIDPSFKAQALAFGSASGDLTVSDGSLQRGKRDGNVVVDATDGCTVSDVWWITGDLKISGPITGKGTIIVDGKVELDAQFDYPADAVTTIFFICTNTAAIAVDLTGNRSFKGIWYVPDGGVRMRGTTSYTGAVLAKNIDLGGTPEISRLTDWDSDPPTIPRIFALSGYQEM